VDSKSDAMLGSDSAVAVSLADLKTARPALQDRARIVFDCQMAKWMQPVCHRRFLNTRMREEQCSLSLLCDIQQELANAVNSVDGKQARGALDKYYFYSADHVNRAAEGFIFLRKSGRIDASKFFVRSVIETMFRVEAIQKRPELFYRIAYSESAVEDPKWIGSAAKRAGTGFDKDALSKGFAEFKAKLASQLPNVALEDKYISVWEIAEAAGYAHYYNSHYRTYCRYTHGALRAIGGFLRNLTDREDNRVMGFCTFSAVNVLAKIGADAPNLQCLLQRLKEQSSRNPRSP
jgi:hypothetical protein